MNSGRREFLAIAAAAGAVAAFGAGGVGCAPFRGVVVATTGWNEDTAQALARLLRAMGKAGETPSAVDYTGPRTHFGVVRFDRVTLTYGDGSVVHVDGSGVLRGAAVLSSADGREFRADELPAAAGGAVTLRYVVASLENACGIETAGRRV